MRCIFFHRVLNQYRIEDFTDSLDPTARDFEAMIQRLKKKHEFISTEQLLHTLNSGQKPDPRWLHLSFDDGFSSTLTAAETCKRHRVPLLVFVSSRVIQGYIPWFVVMRAALVSASRPLTFNGQRWNTSDPRQAIQLNNLIKAEVYKTPGDAIQLLKKILQRMGISELPAIQEKYRFLNARELKQLLTLDADVGSHGATHISLPNCSDAELAREVKESRKELGTICGRAPRFFSYPEGLYDERIIQAVREAGYEMAFAVVNPAQPLNRFALQRHWYGRNVEALGRQPQFRTLFNLIGRVKARAARISFS